MSTRCVPLLALALLACGDNEKRDRGLAAFAQTAVAQIDGDSVVKEVREADAAQRRDEFEVRQTSKEKEEQRVKETLAQIAVLPEKLPANAKAACQDMIDAYHEFQLKVLGSDDGAILAWYQQKRFELGERKNKCLLIGSRDAAACQAHALRAAPADFRGHELAILSACVSKFAPEEASEAQQKAPEPLPPT